MNSVCWVTLLVANVANQVLMCRHTVALKLTFFSKQLDLSSTKRPVFMLMQKIYLTVSLLHNTNTSPNTITLELVYFPHC